MIERNGSIFDTDAKYIGHGVNVQGVMGAGIAKQFRAVYGEDYYNAYREDCRSGALRPGGISTYGKGDKMIVNLASQRDPGPDARYDWLFSAAYDIASGVHRFIKLGGEEHIIALPEIGCGIGGLNWPDVKRVLTCVEELFDYRVEFEVWHWKD